MRRAAFSLTELILAVILAAVLAGIAVPSYVKMVEKSRVRDAQSALRMIFQAERIYRLDNQSYGRLAEDLVAKGYLTDPDPGDSNKDWNFSVAGNLATDFTATATRTGGGAYNGNTVTVNQAFDGSTFGGNHPLR